MVVTLEENKENENVPGSSGLQRREVVIRERGKEESEEEEEFSIPRKLTARKNKEKADRKEFRKNMRKRALDIWKCEDCEEEYDGNDPRLLSSVMCVRISVISSAQDTNIKQRITGKLTWKI